MRKTIAIWVTIVCLLLGSRLADFAEAAAPNLVGTWSGTLQRINLDGCSNLNVILKINRQCENLVSGEATVGTVAVKVVGKITADSYVVVRGIETTKSITLGGDYSASPGPKIVVNYLSYSPAPLEAGDLPFDASFTAGSHDSTPVMELLLL